MRFLIIAFVTTSFTTLASAQNATPAISPEIFTDCEKKSPTDFKQQLACVKEQVAAINELNKLKAPVTREIAVVPKPGITPNAKPAAGVALSEPETAPPPKAAAVEPEEAADDADAAEAPEATAAPEKPAATAVTDEPAAAVAGVASATFDPQAYCNGLFDQGNQADDWANCMDDELDAHKSIASAITRVSNDINGDPYATCRDFSMAFAYEGPEDYVPQRPLLNCLKAKRPARTFSECYRNFVGKVFNRDVRYVPAKYVKNVAGCFNATLTGY